MKIMALCMCGFLLGITAHAQDAPLASRLADLNARAAEVDKVRRLANSQVALSSALQKYGDAAGFLGDADGALAALDEARNDVRPGGSAAKIDSLDDAHSENAIQAIVSGARGKRVVLINESHHQPMNRAFAHKLAMELRKIGFAYLACETFSEEVDAQPKYVTAAHGYYTKEPVFATFVNYAVSAGWTLVSYEYSAATTVTDPSERIRLREWNQAKNIYDRIFAHDPNAKVLIYVGYGHLIKQEFGGMTMMGTYLRQILGDAATLHVDQAQFFAHAEGRHESALYRPLLAKFPSSDPFIVRRADGSIPALGRKTGHVDMEVVFPDYRKEQGRPAWLVKLAERTPVPVPANLMPVTGKRLIFAYGKDHGSDAIPLDAVLVEAGKPARPLMVPAGKMRFAAEQ